MRFGIGLLWAGCFGEARILGEGRSAVKARMHVFFRPSSAPKAHVTSRGACAADEKRSGPPFCDVVSGFSRTVAFIVPTFRSAGRSTCVDAVRRVLSPILFRPSSAPKAHVTSRGACAAD